MQEEQLLSYQVQLYNQLCGYVDLEGFSKVSTIPSVIDPSLTYITFQVNRGSIVLFSRTKNIPLAAVTLVCQDSTPSLFTPRSDNPTVHFQGLIAGDARTFGFRIQNFCLNGIKIDIMKNDTSVTQTDPGAALGGLNQVNELRELEIYTVWVDQEDKRELILTALKDTITGRHLTVKEDEDRAKFTTTGKTQCAKYYLSVTPKVTDTTVVDLFKAGTYWETPEFVTFPCRQGIVVEELSERRPQQQCAAYVPSYLKSLSAIDDEVPTGEGDEESCIETECCINRMQKKSYNTKGHMATNETVDMSYAGQVQKGGFVNEMSNKTGFTYCYDVPTNIDGQLLCFALSVADFFPIKTEDVTLTEHLKVWYQNLEDVEAKRIEQLYATCKKWDAEKHCSICLEETSMVLFYVCGHQCVCQTCLTGSGKMLQTCPMCRRMIQCIAGQTK